MLPRRYGQVEFSKKTGIGRTTLHNLQKSGKCVEHTSVAHYDYYIDDDFYNPEIRKRMIKKGKRIPKGMMS